MTATDRFAGTMPVQDKQRFDVARLAGYLQEHIAGFGTALEVEQFKGGQSNPTYLLRAGDARYVLRRKPTGKLLPSAHAVDREYRVISALAGTGVPVPKTYLLCQDDGVIGTAFYVMDYVAGRVFWAPTLPELERQDRGRIFDEMNRVLAALHQVDPAAVGLGDFGRPGNYIARQIERWTRQYRASETERIEAMERLIEWLPQHVPAGDETSIVHGDYRIDNIIFHPSEPRALAVLDWELSTLGHPLADFAYNLMAWRLAPGQFRGICGLDIAALGIPSEQEYVEAYCRRSGREHIAHLDFYVAYNMFRLAGILQGIMRRVIDGTAASPHAVDAGQRARPTAEAGWALVQQIERGTKP